MSQAFPPVPRMGEPQGALKACGSSLEPLVPGSALVAPAPTLCPPVWDDALAPGPGGLDAGSSRPSRRVEAVVGGLLCWVSTPRSHLSQKGRPLPDARW